ncbi:MAG: hypothetical protein V1885_00340 [Candidatus Brennerbacteria bacterium]
MYILWILLGVACLMLWKRRYAIQRWYHARNYPRIYRCAANGVTGIVLAEDYDRVSLKHLEHLRSKRLWSDESPRFIVEPTFLFSDHTKTRRSRLVGDSFDLRMFCIGCRVEDRTFYLPPEDGDVPLARRHGLDLNQVHFWERLDRLYTFEEAYGHIHKLEFPRPGLEIFDRKVHSFALWSGLSCARVD